MQGNKQFKWILTDKPNMIQTSHISGDICTSGCRTVTYYKQKFWKLMKFIAKLWPDHVLLKCFISLHHRLNTMKHCLDCVDSIYVPITMTYLSITVIWHYQDGSSATHFNSEYLSYFLSIFENAEVSESFLIWPCKCIRIRS